MAEPDIPEAALTAACHVIAPRLGAVPYSVRVVDLAREALKAALPHLTPCACQREEQQAGLASRVAQLEATVRQHGMYLADVLNQLVNQDRA